MSATATPLRPLRRPPRAAAESSLFLGHGRLPRVLVGIALVALTIVWLLPFVWAIATSLQSAQDAASPGLSPIKGALTTGAYEQILERGNITRWALNSFLIAGLVTLITVAVSTLAAYGFSRGTFRGRRVLLAVTVASILVPPQLLIVPLFKQMLLFHLVDTYAAVVLPQVVAPMMVFILKRFFDAIPRELEDAARMDGASEFRVFLSIVLPLSRPIVSAVAIFVFIGAWNNFLWPFIVTNDADLMTLPVGLATVKDVYGIEYAQSMASALLAALPLIVVYLFFQRRIVDSVATTGLGGS
ncbi:multiple sugar transport system permease protein [Streptomyces sp. SAI-135]|uniref:carbohydrate ABC transporter permease n=1 Tax=unclassified Streptomyces TaxID=2593676 RepID=UPI002473BE2E|nr:MULTISPECIES: carbohydrate ABC transporter permease [unclassified Streptomyces]MDH6523052.1 multiple sugar transport system permease protein [Streptomyces sp. SAI-090]MDH6554665.1 multiple sugar transport system permease protein [Streptomyces sp. SAI-041]MDH6573935.1 multiple sugar transport system permease protein [Streptomyces sp. SAI-117]MDH6581328.1 multiple sugar transport system permease protein [Streptomyces sp. SAI-133]MDH6613335.1 multiple sugar transport system permease protein [S